MDTIFTIENMTSNTSDEKHREIVTNILETAARHFAEKGLEGARVDEIAADAGVNKATMYYHIGNKLALYERVFNAPFERTLEQVESMVDPSQQPSEQLRAYIRAFAKSMSGRFQYFPSIMMQEVVSGARNMPEKSMALMCQVQMVLRKIISEGIELGVFRDVNPFMVHMLVIGSITVYTTGEPLRNRMMSLFEQHPLNQEKINKAEALEEIVDMIVHSVQKG